VTSFNPRRGSSGRNPPTAPSRALRRREPLFPPVRLALFSLFVAPGCAFAQDSPCRLMVLNTTDATAQNKILTFKTESAVETFFGATPGTCIDCSLFTIAKDWWGTASGHSNTGYGACKTSTDLSLQVARMTITSARARQEVGIFLFCSSRRTETPIRQAPLVHIKAARHSLIDQTPIL
jgi:hypothetical protein